MPSEELELKDLRTFQNIYETIVEDLDLDLLARNITNIAAKHLGVAGLVLTLLTDDRQYIYAHTITSGISGDLINRVMGDKFRQLQPIDQEYTLTIKAINNNQIYFSAHVADMTSPPAPRAVSNLAQRLYKMKGVIVLPVSDQKEKYGALICAFQKKVSEITEHEISLLKKFSTYISYAIKRSKLYEKEKQQVRLLNISNNQLSTIYRITNQIVTTLDPTEVAQRAVDSVPSEMKIFGAIISRYDKESEMIVPLAATRNELKEKIEKLIGVDFSNLENFKYSINDPHVKERKGFQAMMEDKSYVTKDFVSEFSPPLPKAIANAVSRILNIKCLAVYPIKARNQIVGNVIFLYNDKEEKDLTQENHDLMQTFAYQVGIGLENANLFNKAKVLSQKLRERNEELQLRNKELDTIFRITNQIVTTLNPDEVAQKSANLASEEMGYIGAVIIKKENPKSNIFHIVALTQDTIAGKLTDFCIERNICTQLNQKNNMIVPMNPDNFIVFESLSEALPSLVPSEHIEEFQKIMNANLFVSTPIKTHNELTAGVVFFLHHDNPEKIEKAEFDLMQTFAYQVGIGLENARLFRQFQQLSQTLEEKNQELEDYARKERDILDIMGHELRTPITIVRNSLAILQTKMESPNPDLEKIKHYIEMALRSARREINIIETMLAATKIEGDKIEIHRVDVDPKEMVSEAIEGQRQQMEIKGLELKVDVPDDISHVFADRSRIQEVIDNFLSNAVKYTPHGSVGIKVEDFGNYVKFSVRDTGFGIPQDQIKRLGTKFFRIKQHITDATRLYNVVRPGGTGLGLYVTYGLVKLHGGEVKVESEINKGSVFSFTVPKYTGQKIEVDHAKSKDLLDEYRQKSSGDKVSDL